MLLFSYTFVSAESKGVSGGSAFFRPAPYLGRWYNMLPAKGLLKKERQGVSEIKILRLRCSRQDSCSLPQRTASTARARSDIRLSKSEWPRRGTKENAVWG